MKSYLPIFALILFVGCQNQTPKDETQSTPPEETNPPKETILIDSVLNKSFVALNDERFLRFEIVVDKNVNDVWAAFTTQQGIESWMAPKIKLDMKVGGSITTYTPGFPDVVLNIPTIIPNELFIYKVNLNEAFTKELRKEGFNLQEVIQFENSGPGRTKITATMMGWGRGDAWDKIYTFFEKNNKCAYENLIISLNGGIVKWN